MESVFETLVCARLSLSSHQKGTCMLDSARGRKGWTDPVSESHTYMKSRNPDETFQEPDSPSTNT